MEISRSYQTTGQIMSGMFCRLCGRPTILSSRLCPSYCSDMYIDREYRTTLPELPEINNEELPKYSPKN